MEFSNIQLAALQKYLKDSLAGVNISNDALIDVTNDMADVLGLFGACNDGCKPGCKTGCVDGCKDSQKTG
jgi:hypothetical protein